MGRARNVVTSRVARRVGDVHDDVFKHHHQHGNPVLVPYPSRTIPARCNFISFV